jgi:hypothetical protein
MTTEQFAKLRYRCQTDRTFFVDEVLNRGLAPLVFPEIFGDGDPAYKVEVKNSK